MFSTILTIYIDMSRIPKICGIDHDLLRTNVSSAIQCTSFMKSQSKNLTEAIRLIELDSDGRIQVSVELSIPLLRDRCCLSGILKQEGATTLNLNRDDTRTLFFYLYNRSIEYQKLQNR
ncbi:hypothetical protein PCC8801_4474 (plasmid) [Rippkaea orientalis PCC 8801]|uniref:Uncharacterized protein n=1 Tax=Rippkaea orientalis (strain PCC 8801 / RF-1) TaxID=41431 RepID=B7K6H1_RIPO1|nr:hypothetical protein [Rippkaea orientalis]ACK68393.1 hypothetical protein PCC8801_4474 [Rippkaea orientalis PCC 8801]